MSLLINSTMPPINGLSICSPSIINHPRVIRSRSQSRSQSPTQMPLASPSGNIINGMSLLGQIAQVVGSALFVVRAALGF